MKKYKIVALKLVLIFYTGSAFSQFQDIELIEGLAESFNSSQSNSPLTENDANTQQDPNNAIEKNRKTIDFIDLEYGYTGNQDFNPSPEPKASLKPLKYFGYEFFTQAPTTFAQLVNTPVPADYIIGPGDNFKIYLYGNVNNEFTAEVNREGIIFFPDLGPITVSGLTFTDAKKVIEQNVTNKIIGTEINITMGSLRSINIFVMGEGYRPGMYSVSSLSTLTNAIFASGGINPSGSLRNIQLKRNGSVISKFDFYDVLLNGDISQDIRLMPMDVIFIPPIGKTVGINGEISRPGIYEVLDSENLENLVQFSGNLKPKASNSIQITRIDREINGFKFYDVPNNQETFDTLDLYSGDLVTVPKVSNAVRNAVLIEGHYLEPGIHAFREGMRISDLLSKDKLMNMTDMSYILIKREMDLNVHEFYQVDLMEINDESNEDADLLLKDRDHILLFPRILTPEQITTRMIQDEIIINENQTLEFVDEWKSMTYLRKSLMEEKLSPQDQNKLITTGNMQNSLNSPDGQQLTRYYEYTIHDYCTIPRDTAIKIIEASGFRAKKSVPIEDLEDIDTPAELLALQKEVENERIKIQESTSDQVTSREITAICRNQLIQPFKQIIDRETAFEGEKKTVSIFGNVHFPGDYPLTNGMSISDAIKSSGGLRNPKFSSEIELSRTDATDKKVSILNSIQSLSDEASMKVALEEMDILNIKEVSAEMKTVKITGEVYFEGEYPISESQTISELINRAGGLTKFADTRAAKLQRKALKEAETRRLSEARGELKRKIVLSSQSGGLGQNALNSSAIEQLTSLLVNDEITESALGRLVIDLDAILSGNDDDLIIEGGDTLHIPKYQQTVSVIGEVYVPNAHVYRSSSTINDYINLSGGSNAFADVKNIYLVKSDGRIIPSSDLSGNTFFRGRGNFLEEGDTIVVPLQIQPFNSIKATTEITQIIYQMALAAAAVNSF